MEICPYLGLESDSTVVLSESSRAHCCYALETATSPTEDYQLLFCLRPAYAECRRYAQAGPIAVSRRVADLGNGAGERRSNRRALSWVVGAAAIVALALVVMVVFGNIGDPLSWRRRETTLAIAPLFTPAPANMTPAANLQEGEDVTPGATVQGPMVAGGPVETSTPELAVAGGQLVGESQQLTIKLPTPTPEPGSSVLELRPKFGGAGWWRDGEANRLHLNDSYLYAGQLNGENYISAVRFDLQGVPRGAPILAANLDLTGFRNDQMQPDAEGTWLIQFVAEKELAGLVGASFMMVYSAPASITLLPQLTRGDLAVDQVNSWRLDTNAIRWLEQQRLDGAETFLVRLLGVAVNDSNTLFGWDSGLGATTGGKGPLLRLALGPEPTATPPLPTREFIVATFTPVPDNALTAVAMQQTATAVAVTTGTYTPVPYFSTPTPFPLNLATVQAAAALQELPAVAVETPVPRNAATATADAAYATAVALTTGTFTPVPTGYVTPFLVLPSPPADNLQTEVARTAEATARAASGAPTSTPLPHNAVIASYVTATPLPANVATAAAQALEATANAELYGTVTPTPWEWVVITATPAPQPTATPTLPVFLPETEFTPTPTSPPTTVEPIPEVLPDEFKRRVFFKTNRTGAEEIFMLDPASGSVGKITRPWVYPLAAGDLAVSPDGQRVAMVKADNNGVLQIVVRSFEYGTEAQITNFARDSYDPAWSPTGEWIAFVGTNSGNDEIYRVSPDGATVQQLTFNQFEWDKHPTWSPDGRQILFYSNRETGRRQLWIMDVDGVNQYQFMTSESEDWDPIWTQ